LIPGTNASIDHIKPRNTHPELEFDILNMKWCDLTVNKAKQNLSNEQFIKMCKEVVNHSTFLDEIIHMIEIPDEVLTETKVNQSA
jgi:hypothetical protein